MASALPAIDSASAAICDEALCIPLSVLLSALFDDALGESTSIAFSTAAHEVLMGTPTPLAASRRAPLGVSSDMPIKPDAAVVDGLSKGNCRACEGVG